MMSTYPQQQISDTDTPSATMICQNHISIIIYLMQKNLDGLFKLFR